MGGCAGGESNQEGRAKPPREAPPLDKKPPPPPPLNKVQRQPVQPVQKPESPIAKENGKSQDKDKEDSWDDIPFQLNQQSMHPVKKNAKVA